MRRISDETLSSGLEGVFLYVLTRSMGNLLGTPLIKSIWKTYMKLQKKQKIEKGDSHISIFGVNIWIGLKGK